MVAKNLLYRHAYSAANDMMEAYQALGWMFPILNDLTAGTLFLPEPPVKPETAATTGDKAWEKRFLKENSLVTHSKRTGFEFATNVPALVYALVLWLASDSKLTAFISITPPRPHTVPFLCDVKGNLLAASELARYKASWWRLKMSHEDFGVVRTFPDALVSLVTNGREIGNLKDKRRDGISFKNLMEELKLTEKGLQAKVKALRDENFERWVRNRVQPSEKDKKKSEEEEEEEEGSQKSDEDEVPNVSDYLVSEGHFGFSPAELRKVFKGETHSNAGDVLEQLDGQISILSEKLVRLCLAREAGNRINTEDNSHDVFSDKFVQASNDQKGKSVTVANGLSNSMVWFLNAICRNSLEMAETEDTNRNPLDSLEDVKQNKVPLSMVREKMALICKDLLDDEEAAANIMNTAILEHQAFWSEACDDEDDKKWRKAISKEVIGREHKYAKEVVGAVQDRRTGTLDLSNILRGQGPASGGTPKRPAPQEAKGGKKPTTKDGKPAARAQQEATQHGSQKTPAYGKIDLSNVDWKNIKLKPGPDPLNLFDNAASSDEDEDAMECKPAAREQQEATQEGSDLIYEDDSSQSSENFLGEDDNPEVETEPAASGSGNDNTQDTPVDTPKSAGDKESDETESEREKVPENEVLEDEDASRTGQDDDVPTPAVVEDDMTMTADTAAMEPAKKIGAKAPKKRPPAGKPAAKGPKKRKFTDEQIIQERAHAASISAELVACARTDPVAGVAHASSELQEELQELQDSAKTDPNRGVANASPANRTRSRHKL